MILLSDGIVSPARRCSTEEGPVRSWARAQEGAVGLSRRKEEVQRVDGLKQQV